VHIRSRLRAGSYTHRLPRVAAGLLVLNALSFGVYLAREAFSQRVFLGLATAALLLVLLAALLLARGGRPAALVGQLQLSLLSVNLLLWMLQALLLKPAALPAPIAALIDSGDTQKLRRRFVEYLPTMPYAKLKADTVVRVPGIYGPADDFVYEWLTDRRGFKNAPAIAALERVPLVALGDSFTEGLGVATERAWPAVLTRRGYPTYSLGVQGYAPAQMAAIWRLYGSRLRPQWVVVGYVGNSYRREGFFLQPDDAIQAAIRKLAQADMQANPLELRKQYRYVGTAVLAFLYARWQTPAAVQPQQAAPVAPAPAPADAAALAQLYKAELELAERWVTTAEALAAAPEWKHAETSLESIANEARAAGARVVFVMLRNRAGMYYRAATGKPLPAGFGEDVEAEALRRLSERTGAFFVDTKPRLQAAASRLTLTSPSEYPYLFHDGHPSPRGHELIADAVQEVLEKQGRTPRE
jgi:lysophospholipase L1-like esterase